MASQVGSSVQRPAAPRRRVLRGAVGIQKNVVLTLVCASVYILLFSNLEEAGTLVQIVSLSGVILAGLLTILGYVERQRPSLYELVLGTACGLTFVSLLANPAGNTPESTNYVVMFNILTIAVLASAMLISRSIILDDLFRVSGYAYLAMIATILVLHSEDIFLALTPGLANHFALRARAFNLHPNLEGFIFGGAFFVLMIRASQTSLFWSLVYVVGAIFSVTIIFASSARAPLVALILSLALIGLLSYWKLRSRVRAVIAVAIVAIVLVALAKITAIGNYLYEILELGSNTRGLDSGGTGRTALWQSGIDVIGSSAPQWVFGSGLRSASPENIGFSTENSYITIVLESGIFIGAMFVVSMFGGAFNSMAWIKRRRTATVAEVLTTGLIIYCLIESFFNRYLFAIGNPLSLMMVFVFIFASRKRLLSRQ